MEDRISREAKLMIAKDIVASYVKGEGGKALAPDAVCDLLKKVYKTVEELAPEAGNRKIGLG